MEQFKLVAASSCKILFTILWLIFTFVHFTESIIMTALLLAYLGDTPAFQRLSQSTPHSYTIPLPWDVIILFLLKLHSFTHFFLFVGIQDCTNINLTCEEKFLAKVLKQFSAWIKLSDYWDKVFSLLISNYFPLSFVDVFLSPLLLSMT